MLERRGTGGRDFPAGSPADAVSARRAGAVQCGSSGHQSNRWDQQEGIAPRGRCVTRPPAEGPIFGGVLQPAPRSWSSVQNAPSDLRFATLILSTLRHASQVPVAELREKSVPFVLPDRQALGKNSY